MNVTLLHKRKAGDFQDICTLRMSMALRSYAAAMKNREHRDELVECADLMHTTTSVMVKRLAESGGHDPQGEDHSPRLV